MSILETLEPVVTLLGCGIASVLFLPRLGISPIVGFIVAGLTLGHHGLGLIPDNETIHLLAELGVVFLLFDIGLHFSLRQVWHERKGIFLLGPLQVFVTAGVFYLIGLQFGLDTNINIVLSLALALSSTAVVSQVIVDSGLQGTPNSNTALAILIFQDICAIFLIILADTFSAEGSASLGIEIAMAMMKCAGCFVVAWLIGEYLLKPIFRHLIRYNNSEVFTMIALFLVLLCGAATGAIGLSLTLGAFLAGMIISETPFKHIIQTELRPFRFLLLSFFFVTVGSSIDSHEMIQHWPLILAVTAIIIVLKFVAIMVLFVTFKEKLENALQQAGLLFQGSEFLFIIIAMPAVSGALDSKTSSILISAVVLTMALSSFVFNLSHRLAVKMFDTHETQDINDDITTTPSHVIIGMNEAGHTLSKAMQYFQIPHLAVDNNYDDFLQARMAGFPVIYGDRADIRFWEMLGINQVQNLVIARPDIKIFKMYEPLAKERFSHVTRYVAVTTEEDLIAFQERNTIPVLSVGVPAGLELAERILSDLGIAANDIALWMQELQNEHLEAVRSV